MSDPQRVAEERLEELIGIFTGTDHGVAQDVVAALLELRERRALGTAEDGKPSAPAEKPASIAERMLADAEQLDPADAISISRKLWELYSTTPAKKPAEKEERKGREQEFMRPALEEIIRRVDELETQDHAPVPFVEVRALQETAQRALIRLPDRAAGQADQFTVMHEVMDRRKAGNITPPFAGPTERRKEQWRYWMLPGVIVPSNIDRRKAGAEDQRQAAAPCGDLVGSESVQRADAPIDHMKAVQQPAGHPERAETAVKMDLDWWRDRGIDACMDRMYLMNEQLERDSGDLENLRQDCTAATAERDNAIGAAELYKSKWTEATAELARVKADRNDLSDANIVEINLRLKAEADARRYAMLFRDTWREGVGIAVFSYTSVERNRLSMSEASAMLDARLARQSLEGAPR